ncbi:hypothetical protein ACFW04_009589 [Cataglyphis niger]
MPPKKKKEIVPQEINFVEEEPEIVETTEPEVIKPQINVLTGEPYGPRVRVISEKAEEESSDDEPESEIEEETRYHQEDQPSEFWHIQKLIKYMKAGNQTATMVSLCLLKDYDLTDKIIQKAIQEMGGLEVLVNLLETNDIKCQNGSLSVLLQIVTSTEMKRYLIDLDITTPLIQMLKHPAKDIQVLTAETLAIIGQIRKARKQIRIRGGIPLINVFREAFERVGMIDELVRHLRNDNVKLKENCALAIFKCASNQETRTMVRRAGGLDPLCKLVQSDEVRANKPLLAAVTGSVWKCAISPENVTRFNQNSLVASLVPLLEENEDERVLANVVGALAECCKDPTNRDVLRANEGLPKLIRLLSATYEPLLENVPLVLKECAIDEKCMDIINDPEHRLDGVRLVWSLLKHPSDVIKRNACLALVPCIRHAKDSPEMVRAFVGGLELTVSLLESKDTEVLAAVCAMIAEIATDPENLGILTDHGVVRKLAALVETDDENLRANLTLAIAYCCEWDRNSYEFGKLNAVAPLVNYMTSKNKDVLKGVCIAVYHLSKEPLNCVTMHTCGVIKHVLRLVGSDDPEVQIAAASTIRHIRKLALTAEKFHFKEVSTLQETDFLL